MKRILFAAFVSILLYSCSGGKKDTGFKGKLTNNFLNGTWIVSQSDFSALKSAPFALRDSLDTRILLHLYQFDAKGKVVSDNGDVVPQNGTYEAEDKLLKMNIGDAAFYYSLERAGDSSMILRIEKNKDPLFEDAKLALKRINTTKFRLDDISWKQAPATPMADDAVRKKLQTMLTYYEEFFRSMKDKEIEVLTHRKILVPVKYFSNGIELRAFEERKGWDVFFGDSTHARTAYTMLEKAFDKIDLFPSRKPPFEIYAGIFAMMAKNLYK